MPLALGPGEHLFDVVETADETRPEVEAFRPELIAPTLRRAERIQSGSQHLVHDVFERHPALAPLPIESNRDVVIEGQSRAHIMMITT